MVLALAFSFLGVSVASSADDRYIDCTMTYSLKGWSVFYKTASGDGRIECDNGQTAKIKVSVKGGGLTFGKSEIVEGTGEVSNVRDISEIFGSYVAAEAHAGAVKSSSASVYTKGEVSLALVGTGRGFDLGVAFGKFKIKEVK
ncbi:MAG: hypothetical protein ABFS37_02725 [Acidobacteriota bacterium]